MYGTINLKLGKCKAALIHEHKDIGRSGGVAPLILKLGTIWRCMISFIPQLFYSWGKSHLFLLNRSLGGPQSQS